jgi:hypothetical protein
VSDHVLGAVWERVVVAPDAWGVEWALVLDVLWVQVLVQVLDLASAEVLDPASLASILQAQELA